MKRAIQSTLLGMAMHCLAVGAETERTWTAASKILGIYSETLKKEKGGVTFKTRPSGRRYAHSIDGKEAEVIGYDQEVFLPAGSTLKLTTHHLGIRVELVKKDSSFIILAERTMDSRSFGQGIEISRAAAVVDDENKLADVEKAKADPLFEGSKFFSPQAPGEAKPVAK